MNKQKKENLTVNQKRSLSSYEREVRRILFNIEKNNEFGFSFGDIPVSSCQADKKFQTLKILLAVEDGWESSELLLEINKKIAPVVKNEIAKTRFFSRVPQIIFVVDKEFGYIEKIRKTLKES